MKYNGLPNNIYFITGNAYAGKSTMVKMLAEKHHGIACCENYHDCISANLDKDEFPRLTYTRDLVDWGDFIRRTPDEYEAWIDGCSKECTILELRILDGLSGEYIRSHAKIFVDTNIALDVLHHIADREKQFLYSLLLKEPNPEKAIANFRECLSRINSRERYDEFLNSGFNTFMRDDRLTLEETLACVERLFKLDI